MMDPTMLIDPAGHLVGYSCMLLSHRNDPVQVFGYVTLASVAVWKLTALSRRGSDDDNRDDEV